MENEKDRGYEPQEPQRRADGEGFSGAAQGAGAQQPENGTTYHYAYKRSDSAAAQNTGAQSAQSYSQNQQSSAQNQQSYAQNQQSYAQNQQYAYSQNPQAAQYGGAPQSPEPGTPGGKKKNKHAIIIAVVIAVCVIAAIAGIIAAVTGSSSSTPQQEDPSSSSGAQIQENTGGAAEKDDSGSYTVAGIAQNCMDSCVGISVYTQASPYSYFYGYGGSSSDSGESQLSGEGSGIIMLEDGGYTYIMTCAHVISDGSSFKVTLNNGEEYDAQMVGADNQTDIGVLRIEATGLKVAEFADSSSAVVGEQVVAIGCPGGLDFMNSVTSGYISSVDRPVSSNIGYDQECIQTDAAINPGTSGGALFNMSGQVIGVNSSKIANTDYEGMGFAVPSNTAVNTANSLIKVGYVEGRAQIGVTYNSISNFSNASAILSALEEKGFEDAQGTMVIREVNADSDLAGKDVREYDMIVAIDGKTLTSTDVVTSTLAERSPGDTVTLTIARIENNSINTFEVQCVLGEATN